MTSIEIQREIADIKRRIANRQSFIKSQQRIADQNKNFDFGRQKIEVSVARQRAFNAANEQIKKAQMDIENLNEQLRQLEIDLVETQTQEQNKEIIEQKQKSNNLQKAIAAIGLGVLIFG